MVIFARFSSEYSSTVRQTFCALHLREIFDKYDNLQLYLKSDMLPSRMSSIVELRGHHDDELLLPSHGIISTMNTIPLLVIRSIKGSAIIAGVSRPPPSFSASASSFNSTIAASARQTPVK